MNEKKWRILNSNWKYSGENIQVPSGNQTIEFIDDNIDNKKIPDNLTIQINPGQKKVKEVDFTEHFQIIVSVEGNGTVSNNNLFIKKGEKAIIEITPDEGYELKEIVGIKGNYINNIITTDNITKSENITVKFAKKKELLLTTIPATGLLYIIDIEDMVLVDIKPITIPYETKLSELIIDSNRNLYYLNSKMYGGNYNAITTFIGKIDLNTLEHIWWKNYSNFNYSPAGNKNYPSKRFLLNEETNSLYFYGRIRPGYETKDCFEMYFEFDSETGALKDSIVKSDDFEFNFNHHILLEGSNIILIRTVQYGAINSSPRTMYITNQTTSQSIEIDTNQSLLCDYAGITDSGDIIMIMGKYTTSEAYLKLLRISNMTITQEIILSNENNHSSFPDKHWKGSHQLIGNKLFFVHQYDSIKCIDINTGLHVYPKLDIPKGKIDQYGIARAPVHVNIVAHKYQNKLYLGGRLMCGENIKIAEIEYNETVMQYTGRIFEFPEDTTEERIGIPTAMTIAY